MSKYKIAILGIGGVGGYIGAKLAYKYSGAEDVEVIFIARGENERVIKSNGLKLITAKTEQTAYPFIVTHDTNNLGFIDLIICCVKNYDLEASVKSIEPCVNDKTIILPLLNGVDAQEKIKKLIPHAEVIGGCIYLVSRLIAPGVIKESSTINQIYLGSDLVPGQIMEQIDMILNKAGLNAYLINNIESVIWEKYFFISTIGTLTSYLDLTIGQIMPDQNHKKLLVQLMQELKLIAKAKKISLQENIIEKTLAKLAAMPYDATSSMHTDFKKGNRTELESLTGHVIQLGKDLNIATACYEQMFNALIHKTTK